MTRKGHESLAEVYPSALQRQGRIYPATIDPLFLSQFEPPSLIEVDQLPPSVEQLDVRDDLHLENRLRADPLLFNGPTVRWISTSLNLVQGAPARYFDMISSCDALRAEIARSDDWSNLAKNPLRAAVHEVSRDPLKSGAGRSAALGVSVILILPRAVGGVAAGSFVVGQRPGTSNGAGIWHVAPSGMLELDSSGRHIQTTTVRELKEELGIDLESAHTQGRIRLIGITQDLTMLKPDLVVRLDLTEAEAMAAVRPVSEFERIELIPLTNRSIQNFWDSHPPGSLTPAAAGAIAALEATHHNV
jgi:8-oxo-dGTP pyrophosphatase MutT (NUDIX family)